MPRNRNRQPGPLNRTLIGSRPHGVGRPATNLLARSTPTAPTTATRSKKNRVNLGSDWDRTSPYYSTAATRDRRWDATISTH